MPKWPAQTRSIVASTRVRLWLTCCAACSRNNEDDAKEANYALVSVPKEGSAIVKEKRGLVTEIKDEV